MLINPSFPYPNAELPERSYGVDCRLYVPENPKNKFINIYVWFPCEPSHFYEHGLLIIVAVINSTEFDGSMINV
jgi:hypothetical protein